MFCGFFLSFPFMQGNIARWLKKEGDKVNPGEVLCEVETVRSSPVQIKFLHLLCSYQKSVFYFTTLFIV